MNMGQPISLFPLDSVSWLKSLTHRFMCSSRKTSLSVQGVSEWKSLLQKPNYGNAELLHLVQLGEISFVCSSIISLSKAAGLSGQSCVMVGVREETSTWKGFSIKLKITLCSFKPLNLNSNSPIISYKTLTNPLDLMTAFPLKISFLLGTSAKHTAEQHQ